MIEDQNIEWKTSWRDEYLKWICGFANAQGGKIYIGKNDKGQIVGIEDHKKLLVDIPNKVQDTMGIIVDVNLLKKEKRHYLEIIVKPSSYPINYRGEYHYRTGSTKQHLKGPALTDFLILKTKFRWDALPIDDVKVGDLDKESFDIFRREALRSNRMTAAELDISNRELLKKLNLMVGRKLKHAAILLFHRNPENFFSGCFVKIGKFGKGPDLQYHDDLSGSFMMIADRVVELIYLKYLKARITYKKEVRIETYPFPREGVREAVFNALIHCHWADNVPIQIRIEDTRMYVSNNCLLPSDWKAQNLMKAHKSDPYNPDIAKAFYRAGYVEAWGRGIQKICDECKKLGTPVPIYHIMGHGMMVEFKALFPLDDLKCQNDTLNGTLNGTLNDTLENKILITIETNPSIKQDELADKLSVSIRTIKREIKNLHERGIIERLGSKKAGYWKIK